MLDIGWSELLLIAVVALLVIKPEDLPDAAKKLGKIVRQVKASMRQFHAQVDQVIHAEEIQKIKDQLRQDLELTGITDVERELEEQMHKEFALHNESIMKTTDYTPPAQSKDKAES